MASSVQSRSRGPRSWSLRTLLVALVLALTVSIFSTPADASHQVNYPASVDYSISQVQGAWTIGNCPTQPGYMRMKYQVKWKSTSFVGAWVDQYRFFNYNSFMLKNDSGQIFGATKALDLPGYYGFINPWTWSSWSNVPDTWLYTTYWFGQRIHPHTNLGAGSLCQGDSIDYTAHYLTTP